MLTSLILGSLMIVANMGIQVLVLLVMLRALMRRFAAIDGPLTLTQDTRILSGVLLILFVGHFIQCGTWALLFLFLGEFSEMRTALYHSIVNFASLGYGDIVMSEQWRMLGALEALNGVLMLGLSSGTLLALMTNLFARHSNET